jgi:hypothetical protein
VIVIRSNLAKSSVHRRDAVHWIAMVLLLPVVFSATTMVASASSGAQALGESNGTYIGSMAYVTTPDPGILPWQWTTGPNGISNFTSMFVESGPSKNYNSSGLHPYGSGQDRYGNYVTWTDTATNLASGGLYQYITTPAGGTSFQSQFCSGNGCEGMVTIDMGQSSLPGVASGAESDSANTHWGTITTSYNTYTSPDNSQHYWCYTTTSNNVGAVFTACSDPNSPQWSITY